MDTFKKHPACEKSAINECLESVGKAQLERRGLARTRETRILRIADEGK
jgi:hypothetical protein